MRPRAALLALLIAVLLLPVRTVAWGFDVHRYITDKAIDLLPDMGFVRSTRSTAPSSSSTPSIPTCGGRPVGGRVAPAFRRSGCLWPAAVCRSAARLRSRRRTVGSEFVTKNGLLPWRTAEIFGQLQRAFEQQQARGGAATRSRT